MASNIPVFDENNQNKLNITDYTDDNERKDGFAGGQPIRSNIMNTVLNITTKAVSAILDAITNSKEINSDSDKQDIVDYVKYGLTKYIDNGIKISGNNTNTVTLQVGNEATKSVVINDVNHATNADNTTNVDTLTNNDAEDNDHIKFTIGDKSFEKTINNVQNATNADKLTANAGSSSQPIYFQSGVPAVVSFSLYDYSSKPNINDSIYVPRFALNTGTNNQYVDAVKGIQFSKDQNYRDVSIRLMAATRGNNVISGVYTLPTITSNNEAVSILSYENLTNKLNEIMYSTICLEYTDNLQISSKIYFSCLISINTLKNNSEISLDDFCELLYYSLTDNSESNIIYFTANGYTKGSTLATTKFYNAINFSINYSTKKCTGIQLRGYKLTGSNYNVLEEDITNISSAYLQGVKLTYYKGTKIDRFLLG